ncbi:proteoglycan 4-like isoform X2 [Branchiostoma lanceolatum]|uniref:proteoglycan 4-like isoform X2 n=1 Tax=Branchiostoma lanceolatum TaxID=7740 RepID=UPI003452898C
MQVVKMEMVRSARVQLEDQGGLSAHQFLPQLPPRKPPPRIEPPKVPSPEKPVTPPPQPKPKKVDFTPAPAPPPPKKHKVKFEEPTPVPAAVPRKVTVGPMTENKTVTKAVVAKPVRGPKTVVIGPVVESREVSTAGREVSTTGREVSTKREESRDVTIKRDETRKAFFGPAQVTTKVETVRGDPSVQRHVETGPVEEVREVITDPDGTKRTIIRRRVVKTTKTTTSTPVITKRVETKTQAVRSGVTRTAESKMTTTSKKVMSSSGESVAKATKTITRQVTPGDVRVETQIKQARSQDKTSVTKRTT